MKPDWCDEATWERVTDQAAKALDAMPAHGSQLRSHRVDNIARALIDAKNEGLEEAAQLVLDHGHGNGNIRPVNKHLAVAIRSRIQKE